MVAGSQSPDLHTCDERLAHRTCQKGCSTTASASLLRAAHEALAPQVEEAGCLLAVKQESQNSVCLDALPLKHDKSNQQRSREWDV